MNWLPILNAIHPGCIAEHRFAVPRRWRFDYCWPTERVALEVEGATWTQGRHTRGAGYRKDCEKYNAAAALGWIVIRATTDMMRDGSVFADLDAVLRAQNADAQTLGAVTHA